MNDLSNGYDLKAEQYLELRAHRRIGESAVTAWADTLAPGSCVLDLGCGDGVPVSSVLLAHGFTVFAIDASPRMVEAYRARFPNVKGDPLDAAGGRATIARCVAGPSVSQSESADHASQKISRAARRGQHRHGRDRSCERNQLDHRAPAQVAGRRR